MRKHHRDIRMSADIGIQAYCDTVCMVWYGIVGLQHITALPAAVTYVDARHNLTFKYRTNLTTVNRVF